MKKPFFSLAHSERLKRCLSRLTARSLLSNLAIPAFMGGIAATVAQVMASPPVWAQAALAGVGAGAGKIAPNSHVEWWEAIVLGLVQGLTEFIPVSSSAHLNITHTFMNHPRELAFDLLLHVGTLAALIYYFRKDYVALVTDPKQRNLRNLVMLGCIPAAIIGVPLEKFQDHPPLSEAWFNAIMLAVGGTVLLLADKFSRQNRDMENVTKKDALIVGAAQAIALIPGVSRSGATLTAGLMLGLKRADAARFSFLLSLPITLGAVLYKSKDFGAINASPLTMALGVGASAASGFWAIGFLLNYLKSKDVTPFFIWRLVVALIVFALFRPR